MKKKFFILFSNSILLVFSLLFFEFYFRFQNKNIKSSSIETSRMIRLRELNPNSMAYFRPSDDSMKYSTSLENKVYKIETDSHGYIMPSGDLNATIKIVFHGGSTTECIYVTEILFWGNQAAGAGGTSRRRRGTGRPHNPNRFL